MKIIGFFFVMGLLAIAFTLLFGFSFLRMLFSAIFGTRPKPQAKSSNQQKKKQTNKQQNTSTVKKIFTHEDGEYVDFEEIKD